MFKQIEINTFDSDENCGIVGYTWIAVGGGHAGVFGSVCEFHPVNDDQRLENGSSVRE